MKKFLLPAVMLFGIPAFLFSQAKLVEKVVKKGDEITIPYEKYVLPNGLTVIVHEDHSDPIVHVDVTYHVGSAREEIGKSGFAHFFEHMMFEGSEHVADKEHFKIVTESGGTLNGSTNLDRTNYYETVPSNQLEKMLWLEADRMGFLYNAVTQPKFEIQRATVKNERGQNYDNRPYGLAGEVASKALYPYGHPYSWLTIGYVEDLNRVNVNDLKNYLLRWYGPNNATLTLGGDVNTKDVIKMVEKYFGSIPRGPEVKAVKLEPVRLTSDRYVSYVDNYAKLPQLRIVYPTVPEYHNDMAALACLSQVLGGGGGGGGRGGRGGGGSRTSVLYQTLIKTQKALQASAFSSLSELTGEFVFSVTPYPDHNLAEMQTELKNALTVFEKTGVTDDDLEKFKNSYESQAINRLAAVNGKVSQLAAYQTFTGNPNMTGKLLNLYRSVTKQDVMRVYNQYIKNKPAVIESVVPKGKEELKAAADNYIVDTTNYKRPHYGYEGLVYKKPKDNFNRSTVPPSGPNPVVKVPAFWKKSLSNGMQVIGVENNEIPAVTISVSLKGGRIAAEQNNLSKAGWTNLFAAMMNEDTKDKSSEDISLALQKLGSSINVSNADDAIVFTVQSLTKNLDKTLVLLQERMLRPDFKEEAFNRIKRQLIQGIQNAKTQPASVADMVYAKVNYGSSNMLGVPEEGTEATLKNIKFKDIQEFYDNYISSKGGEVVVVGDVKENLLLSKLSFLNQLPKKDITLPPVAYNMAPAQKTRIYIVDIPKAAQTEFRVGYPTGLKYDATGDYYRARLANYNLGEGFNSRLNINLREDKGWTYGARGGFAGDKYSGVYTFSSGIRAMSTDSALSEVIREIKLYNQSGPSAQEIQFMKKSIGQSDARNYETGVQKAAFVGRIMRYNLPADYVNQQTKILNAFTVADANALIKKYIDVNKMNIVLVGDKEKILPGLQRLGYDIVELDVEGNPVTQ
ncbi:MAG: insulinase family protein [Chitinophagaceae bacterium]|nr:insulinase family protein [Chitinophagaceae bacterium]